MPPDVTGIKEAGGDILYAGSILEGQYFKRSGLSIVGDTPSGAGVPGNTVVNETSFGQSPVAGSSIEYSRKDHTHGSPTDPVPAHAALTTTAHGGILASSSFSGLSKISVGITQPPTPSIGDLWADTN